MALEVQEANLGAVNNQKVELEEATPEDRTETASQPEEPVMRRSHRKRQRQIAEMEHRSEELGRRRVEDPRESHYFRKSGRREQPTAGRREQQEESREQKE